MGRKKRDEAEIEAVRQELPLNPPEKVVEIIKQRQKAAQLVYRAGYCTDPMTGVKTKAALVQCTACGEKYYLPYTYAGCGCHSGGYGDPFAFVDPYDNEPKVTGRTCLCPECGVGAQALHISHIRKKTYLVEKTYFMTIHNIRGHFVSLSWVLFKECDKNANIHYTCHRYEGIAIIGGLPIRYTGYSSGMFGDYWFTEWTTRAVWKDNTDEWDAEDIFMDRAAFDSSDASKSGLEEYIINTQKKIRVGAYLQLWAKYPQIENLVRSGLTEFVGRLIEHATAQRYYYSARDFSIKKAERYFDRKKVKPHEMLGLDKSDLPLANKLPLDQLEFYRLVRDVYRIKPSKQQLQAAQQVGIVRLSELIKTSKSKIGIIPPFVRTLNYLTKQKSNERHNVIDAKYLFDYWIMTRDIQGGLPPELLYPKNLERAHDLAVIRKKEVVDAEINRKIADYSKTLTWLAFEDKKTGLCIRPAASQEELIKEGKCLSHCVGTYAKTVARRETSILFIRHIDDPEIPYFTLEYRNGRVLQNRGKNNCERAPEVVEFEKKWIKYINNYKERNNNGKRNGNQAAAKQAVGA